VGRSDIRGSYDQPRLVKAPEYVPTQAVPCSATSTLPGTSWTMKCQRPDGHQGMHARYRPGTAEVMHEWNAAS
jgi:hypothetical protein